MLIDDSTFILQGLDGSIAFAEFSAEEKAQLTTQATVCQYAKGTTVFSADHHGDAFYLVLSGNLLIRLKNKKTKPCRAGEIFGEVAIFDNRSRTGTIQVQESAVLARFEKNRVFNEDHLPPLLRAKVVVALTRQIISYLYDELPVSSRELIMKGESETIEFKASAHEDHFPKIVRTVAAMMNSQGGTILLGVEDGGGLNNLRLTHTGRDVLVRKLNMMIHNHLGEYPCTLVHIDAEIIDGCEIIRIDCEPSAVPVFVTENEKEALFVRISRENKQIRTLRDCIHYIKKRFSETNTLVN